MENTSKKFAMTVGAVLLAIIVLGSALFLLLNKITQKDEAIKSAKNTLAVYEKRIKSSQSLKDDLGEAENWRSKIESVFFERETMLDFIKRLEYLAQMSGVSLSLQSVSFSESDGKKPGLSLTLEGKFADVYRYLSLLENDYYRISIEKAYIQQMADKNSKTDNWESGLEISLLSFKQ